jgi:hypothetical protein
LKPYRGKLAVRNFRGGNGDVGIIRSPLRAIALPDSRAGRWISSMSEIPVHSRPRRLADWINPTGAKKVHSLIDKVYQRKNLEMAWEKVKANRGSGGVDGQSLETFAAQADQQLDRQQGELKDDAYRPQPVRQVQIPKVGKPGEFRTLGVPTIKLHVQFSRMQRSRRLTLPRGNRGNQLNEVHQSVFAVKLAHLDQHGKPLPGVAQVAIQQGALCKPGNSTARNI